MSAVKKPGTRGLTASKAAAKQPAARGVTAKKTAARQPAAKPADLKKVFAGKPTTPISASAEAARRRPRIVEAPPPPAPETRNPETKPAIDVAAREKAIAREHAATAVNRALSLLETLARTGPVPLAVLADAAGCGKTAAFELLTTMQTRNFVIQDDTHGLWQLGARWAVLGSAASEQGALAATAMPFLAALGNATGENVYLRVREGMETETVAIYQTDPGLRVYTEVGKKMPLHAGSGRLLLAHAPEAVQTQVLAQRLQRYTPSTRTDPSWIAADLHRIRTRGFLITDSEVVAGTVSVCAAVRDASGQVVAALLIGAPSLRMRPPRPRALMPAVVEAARKLSHALGSISEQPAAPGNGQMEARALSAFSGSAWPTNALGATITRPHSIFR
jgi:DNA-binding IclR family transcriptional regulator